MPQAPRWPLTLYYDGDCPLCAREIQLLSRHANAQRLLLIDIGSADFPATSVGIDGATLANRLHARFADDQWVTGLDATLWSWRAAGLGRCARFSSWVTGCSAGYARSWPGYPIQKPVNAANANNAAPTATLEADRSGWENSERRHETASRRSRQGAAPCSAARRSIGRSGRRSVRNAATARQPCAAPLNPGALPSASDTPRTADCSR